MTHRDEEVRPFFGESAPIIQGAPFSLERGTPVVSMTPMERALAAIDAGECPTTGCPGRLEDGACSFCGQSLADWRKRNRITPEADPEYVPTLPGALFVDEYAEANIEPEAA